MTLEIAIEATSQCARAALLKDGRLLDLRFTDEHDLSDRIALGRVLRVERDLDAAFIDLGTPQPGYLDGARRAGVREGDAIIVQVRRDPLPGKGAALTTDLALVGRLLMARPRHAGASISATLAKSSDRQSHRARAALLFPEGGVLLRTAAATATDQALLAEAGDLRARWRGVEARAKQASPPAWLDAPAPPAVRVLEDFLPEHPKRIALGDATGFAAVRTWLERHAPDPSPTLERISEPFEALGVTDQLAAALEPEVPLVGGGRLIIEPTAALVAIDVDGGPRTALEVDLEAAYEVAQQVRLRALGGSIVVDFVDLADAGARKRLDKALRLAFQRDPEPVRIWPMGPLGLVQISRRRRGPSLAERLMRVCPGCAGSGRMRG